MLWSAALFFALAAAACAAPPAESELRAWVTKLDAEAYPVREEASRQLIAAGTPAIDAISAGLRGLSPEAAWRAAAALEQIALRNDEQAIVRVTAALEAWRATGRPRLAKLIAGLESRHAEFREARAAARIRALGGKLTDRLDGSIPLGGFFAGAFPVQEANPFFDLVEVVRPEVPPLAPETARTPEAPPAVPDLSPAEHPGAIVEAPLPPPAALPPPLEGAAEGIELAIGDAFIGEPAWWTDAVSEEALEATQSLVLDQGWKGGDAGLAVLADLPAVASITIDGAPLSDAGLAHLATLPKLAEISVQSNGRLTSAALAQLRQDRPGLRIYARGEGLLGVNVDLEGPCVLTGVHSGSGAAEAGLAVGDEIVSVAGRTVRDFSDLTIAVFGRRPGDKLPVEYRREGQLRASEVRLKDRRSLVSP